MIGIENLSKSYGGQVLFDDVSFKLNQREKLGLVGRNGHGKTTLLRLITGEEEPDAGAITIPKHYRIGQVRQHLDFNKNTILEEGMTGLPDGEKDHFWKVEKILGGLGFSSSDMNRHPGEFSGGFQVRLNLAKVLVSEPDLLLLDEPTNYLDITSIRWIEGFLSSWSHELVLITHDRTFMDKVVTHTLGINRKKIRKIPGNTQKYYSQIAQDEEIYEKTRINDERKRKEIEQFITRFRAKARLANLVQSRIKTLEKMGNPDKLENIKTLDFSFRSRPLPGKHVLSVDDISFGYEPDTPIVRNLSLSVSNGDRICIIGKNGKGKTTLLKLLGNALTPQQGRIKYNPNVTRGFYEQTNIKTLVDSRTVEEEIMYAGSDVDKQTARNICGAMMFEGNQALKKISVLSGGEKSRVMLGKILATPANLLLLDEPTNHLDMESCDSLLSAIDNFEGTVIMVTHNEMFLNALARRLIIFQNDRIEVFQGDYQRFLEKIGWHDESGEPSRTQAAAPDVKKEKLKKKQIRQRRSEIVSRRSRETKPLEQKIESIENRIETLEIDLDRFNQEMVEASQQNDGPKIADLSRCIHQCRSDIDTLFEELETRTVEYENKKAEFDLLLEDLDS